MDGYGDGEGGTGRWCVSGSWLRSAAVVVTVDAGGSWNGGAVVKVAVNGDAGGSAGNGGASVAAEVVGRPVTELARRMAEEAVGNMEVEGLCSREETSESKELLDTSSLHTTMLSSFAAPETGLRKPPPRKVPRTRRRAGRRQ